jgi:hypothetical protein
VNKHEEFYGLLMFFVERHYLRKYGTDYRSHVTWGADTP